MAAAATRCCCYPVATGRIFKCLPPAICLPFVQVKDWGSGQPAELGSLELEQDATRVFEAADSSAASSESGGGGASPTSHGMPFHETLARRLELLQSQGALGNLAQVGAAAAATAAAGTTAACPPQFRRGAIPQVLWGHALGSAPLSVHYKLSNHLQMPGGKPLPPFEQWAFALQHYEQVRVGYQLRRI